MYIVPQEIFQQIKCGVNLYKTCKQYYHHVETFYKRYVLNTIFYESDHVLVNSVLYIPVKTQNIETMDYISKHIYNVLNYNPAFFHFDKLVSVTLSPSFNAPLVLPLTVKKLILGKKFNHPLPTLPALVKLVCSRGEFNQPLINLSSTLQVLELSRVFCNNLILPPNLKKFIMGSFFNSPVQLPNTLKYFFMGFDYNQDILLPESLRHLHLGSKFTKLLKLPQNLKTFHMNRKYTSYIDFSLINLYELWIGDSYIHPLKLPPTLRILHITKEYPLQIHINELPLTLKTIHIGLDRIVLDKFRLNKNL